MLLQFVQYKFKMINTIKVYWKFSFDIWQNTIGNNKSIHLEWYEQKARNNQNDINLLDVNKFILKKFSFTNQTLQNTTTNLQINLWIEYW